jgi:hypothetical protein
MIGQDDLQDVLKRGCEDHFPYACTGQKTQMQDGSVSCECGAKIAPNKFKESSSD